MKKTLLISVLLSSIYLYSCSSLVSPEKQIAKEWLTSSLVFKTDVKDFTIARSGLGINLKINKDGSYEYPSADSTAKGKWKIVNDDKQLELIDANNKLNLFEIISLEKTGMTLAWAKIDLTKTKPSQSEADLRTLYEDFLSFGKLYVDYINSKPKWIQLQINYVPK